MQPARIGTTASAFAALALAVFAAPASAHVTLHSTEAVQGGSDASIAIRVPNEEDQATTTRVEADFPPATPLVGLVVRATPGWLANITRSALPSPITTDDGTVSDYVSKVVWSGGSIPVGGYEDFSIAVGALPKAPTVTIKVLQTYSNGDLVRWIDPPSAPGQPDPAHPAPTLELAAAPGGRVTGAPSASLTGYATRGDVRSTKDLSLVALVIGAGALILAGLALAIRRRPGSNPSEGSVRSSAG